MLTVARRTTDRALRHQLRLFQLTEARETMRQRRSNLVLLRLDAMRHSQMLERSDGVGQPNIEQMTQIVVVPGIAGRQLDRAAVRCHRHAIVTQQGL
jgi:hypothetical protein